MADTKKQHEVAIDSLVNKGWSREQATGIAANLAVESQFDPSAVGDGGKAYGIAQWHPDRQAVFQQVYGKPIQGSTQEEQLAFLDHELRNGNEKSAGAKLAQAKSAADAAGIVSQFYERPRDTAGEITKRGKLAASMAGDTYVPSAPSLPTAKAQQGPASGQQGASDYPVLPTAQNAAKGASRAADLTVLDQSSANIGALLNDTQTGIDQTTASGNADVALQTQKDAQTFGATFRTALGDPRVMTTWSVLDRFNQAPDIDAGAPPDYYLQNMDKIEAGIQSDEQRAFLRENVHGPESLTAAQARLSIDKDNDDKYGLAGGATGFFGQAAAGLLDPVGLLAGAGVAKAFKLGQIGHAAYIAAGRGGAATLALAAESGAANIAIEGIADAMGETKTSSDYVMAGAMGAAMTLPFVRGTFKEASHAHITGMLDDFQNKAVIEQATKIADMQRQYPEAPAAEIARRVQDAETADILTGTSTADRPQLREQMIPAEVADQMRKDFDGTPPERIKVEPEKTPDGETIPPAVDENADIHLNERQDPIPLLPEDVSKNVSKATEEGGAFSREIPGKDGHPVRLSWWLKEERDVKTQGSLRETLDTLLDKAQLSGVEKRTVKYLQSVLSDDVLDNVRFRFSNNAKARNADFSGTDRTISIRSETTAAGKSLADNLDGVSGWHTYAVIHEVTHAATHSKIQAYLESKGQKRNARLDGTMLKALNQFEDLHERYKAELTSWKDAGLNDAKITSSLDYAGKNLHEFAAQLHSDDVVRSFLSNMEGKPVAGRPTSAWHEFIGLLTKMLGGKRGDAFREGSKLLDVIIRADGSNIKYAGGQKALQAMGGAASSATKRNYAVQLYQSARDFVQRNPIDIKRTEVLMRNTGGVSDGLVLARSKNPIMQMAASLMMETTTGAAGRKANAGIRSVLLHRKFVGNALIDFTSHYEMWRKANGGGIAEDHFRGEKRREFNTKVYEETLARRSKNYTPNQDLAVRGATDALEALFERARVAQIDAGTLGSAGLPGNSRGYMPQTLDGAKLSTMSTADMKLLHTELSNQFQANIGWDKQFSDLFAEHYTERVRLRSVGDKGFDGLAAGGDGSQVIRDTLDQMGLDPSLRDKAKAALQKSGALGQTKAKLDLDLTKQLRPGLRLMDAYVTDPDLLARTYAKRTAGMVALTEQGVHGWRGIQELRRAAGLHMDDAEAATKAELMAFDRVVAELTGIPSGQEVISAGATNLRLFTGLQRLGGLVIQQAAETFNLGHHLGYASILRGVPLMAKQMGEIGRMKKGTQSTGILHTVDVYGGEIGMEHYKMAAPLDAPDGRLGEYMDQPGLASRLLRAGGHLQSKLSGFRGVMAAQHRMVAEQIVHKSIKMVRDGTDSVALKDMGFTPDLVAELKLDLNRIAQFDQRGNLTTFDLSQASDPRTSEAFVQSVHRGVSQIIQGTFPGERSKWASNDYMNLLLQLRQFGILAAEKSWGRQVAINGGGVRGYSYAAGVMMGQMALAAPILWSRIQLNAAGRPDREQFIKDQLNPAAFVKGLMNYSSMTGFASDVLDITAGMAGGWGDKEFRTALGAREQATGVGRIVPVAGTVDNMLKVLSGKTDAHTAIKQSPFSNLWYLQPALNITKTD